MAEVLEKCPDAIENAKNACKVAGVDPLVIPVRGGTDGANPVSYTHLSVSGDGA